VNTPPEDRSHLLGSGNACHAPRGSGDDDDVSCLDPGRLLGLRV
jgi:hypothetical protein